MPSQVLKKYSIDDPLIDSILSHFLTEKKKGHFLTLRGESGDLEELFSSLFVYLLLIV